MNNIANEQSFLGRSIRKIITNNLEKINRVANKVPSALDFLKSLNPEELFDLNMSEKAKDLYSKGELFLKLRKDGRGHLPILSDKTGEFVEQIALKSKKLTPREIETLSNLAMQQQLAEIIQMLEAINETLEAVLAGQQNDRIGLYLSAKQQYLESLMVKDHDIKKYMLYNCIKTANDARFQVMETVKHDMELICHLPKTSFEQIMNSKNIKKTDNAISNVRLSIKIINDCTGIIAASYSELGQRDALLSCLNPFKEFLKSYLIDKKQIPNMLQQYDSQTDNMWLNKPKEIYQTLLKLNELDKCDIVIGIPAPVI